MLSDVGFYLKLLSALLAIIIFVGFNICCRRLELPRSACRKIRIKIFMVFFCWFSVIFYFGQSDRLSNFDQFPPPFMLFFITLLLFSLWMTFSNLGLVFVKGLTYAELIGLQSFRIGVELVLILGAQQGLTPKIMTLHGWNFDLLTGLSALVLYFYLPRFPNLKYIITWNWLGVILLAIVISLGFFSFPAPWRFFITEPSNIWITHAPYLLLPGFLVTSALILHLMVFRKLRLDPKEKIKA